MGEGALPNLARLAGTGSFTVLRSTNPPITFPAIPSFATGKDPGGHGVCCFFRPEMDGSLGLMSSKDLKGEFWNVRGMAERRKLLVNFPLTYPAKPTNGIILAGLMAPDKDTPGFTFPPEKAQELGDLLREYVVDLDDWYLAGGEEEYLGACERITRARTDVFLELLGRERWDLAIVYYTILDKVQHNVFGKDDNKWLRRAYAFADAEVGRIVASLGPGTDVIVFSDHGFGRSTGRFLPNAWLEREGLLIYKKEKGSSLTQKVMKGLRGNPILSAGLRLLPDAFVRNVINGLSASGGAYDLSSVDWDASLAYATVNGIYINEKVVKDKEGVLARIEKGLGALTGRDGRPLSVRTWRREAVYRGDSCEKMPHLVYCIEGHAFEPFPSFETGDPIMYFDREFKGWHREEGILVVSGPDFARDARAESSIWDVAPTVLHLFGVPIPKKMDGRVIKELFRSGSVPATTKETFVEGDFDEEMRLRRAIGRIRLREAAARKGG
jgi:predicted AlkP superfamily phosphohydrolase/phosphomutase